jgi:hypothetical protein
VRLPDSGSLIFARAAQAPDPIPGIHFTGIAPGCLPARAATKLSTGEQSAVTLPQNVIGPAPDSST